MRQLSVETRTHGRVLIDEPADRSAAGLIVAFHGYGQGAEEALAAVRLISGHERWCLVAPQALHRFYTRGDRAVVASWMTRQDRDVAIADNIAYVDRVVDEVLAGDAPGSPREHVPIVFAGFSQGAAMAYRAAIAGRHDAAGIMAVAGGIPPEIASESTGRRWPPVLIGAGHGDDWYNAEKIAADVAVLTARGVAHEVVRFDGGHEWTAGFGEAAGRWMEAIAGQRFTSR
jgi:predicted esterase